MRTSRPSLAVGVVCAVAALVPAAAQAMTLSVGKPQLSDRILVTVPLTVSCSAFEPSLTLVDESVSATVEQAAGKAIARGDANLFPPFLMPVFPCDGSSNTIALSMTANTAGPPFHGGGAIVSATAGAGAGVPCFPGSTTCFDFTASQVANTGPTQVKL